MTRPLLTITLGLALGVGWVAPSDAADSHHASPDSQASQSVDSGPRPPAKSSRPKFVLPDPDLPHVAPHDPRSPSVAAHSLADEPDASEAKPHFDAIGEKLISTNILPPKPRLPPPSHSVKYFQDQLEFARQRRRAHDADMANRLLTALLDLNPPPELKSATLLEMALVAQDEGKLPRANQILAQFINLYPRDPAVPEVMLRQGLIYRQLGAHQLALAKFYAVMSTALNLKLEQFEYYRRIVLQAQTEIADTYFTQGKFSEATDFYTRLLKTPDPQLNEAQVRYKFVRALHSLGRHPEASAQAEVFLERFPESAELPEVRFLLASSYKQMGRNRPAMQQVLALLAAQSASADRAPQTWAYWQQRAGNEIGNQFYRDSDYVSALEIYLRLLELDKAPSWQLPVYYQLGLVSERLNQPQKAEEYFATVVAREKELVGEFNVPSLKALVDMARWRKEHLGWQQKVARAANDLRVSATSFPREAATTKSP